MFYIGIHSHNRLFIETMEVKLYSITIFLSFQPISNGRSFPTSTDGNLGAEVQMLKDHESLNQNQNFITTLWWQQKLPSQSSPKLTAYSCPDALPPEYFGTGCSCSEDGHPVEWLGACLGHFSGPPDSQRSDPDTLLAERPPKKVLPFQSTFSAVCHSPWTALGCIPDVAIWMGTW